MYSDKTEKICSYCFYKTDAKGLREHIYCAKRKEYRGIHSVACDDYEYDIRKRPVRRKKTIIGEKKYDFEI